MGIRVLGPMELGAVTLGARERTILSALIVRRGEALRPAEIAEASWGDALPPTWQQQIRNSVARIRMRLGPDAVVTVASAYRLGLDPESIDSVRFERLASDARAHALQGEDARAIDAYRRALALWRGAPLQDVKDWEPAEIESRRLLGIRASLEEELLDARLRVGEHRAVLPDAERLVREEPLREDRWAILALANYRSERQAEALATIRAARERLDEELGVEPGKRLAELETAILRQDPSLEPPAPAAQASAVCPYPGLRAFGPDEADLYFGREGDIDAVCERARPGAMITVAGPSGIGKSSLVLAGVAPRLEAAGRPVAVLAPGPDVGRRLTSAAARAQVVILDHAEEMLRLPDDERDSFGDAVADAIADGRTIVATLRSDALDSLRALPQIGDAVASGIHLLGPISVDGCREAIEEPARRSGLRLEPGLVELALRDVGDRSGTLPHLAHALRETWLRSEGGMLTVAGYESSGGIAGAVAQSAESVYLGFGADERELCRSLLLRLIELGEDGTPARRRVPVDPLLADPERRSVVEALARARLLTIDQDSLAIAHESVASAWPRLSAWLDESADRVRIVRIIEASAAVWRTDGENDDDLLRGARLHLAETAAGDITAELTESEREFLARSAMREQSAVRELELRAVRERARNRTLRASLGGAAALLAISLVAGTIAVVRGREATTASESAHVEALVASSLALRENDRDAAALLAAEAYRRWPDDGRVRSALWGVMTSADGLLDSHRTPGARQSALAAIPGTGTALQVSDSEEGTSAVELVDLESKQTTRTYDVDLIEANRWLANYRDVAVSDDGGTAVIQSGVFVPTADGEECCWNELVFLDLDSGETLPGSQLLKVRTSLEMDLGERGEAVYLQHPITGDLLTVDARTGEVRTSDARTLEDHTGDTGTADAVTVVDERRVATAVGDRIDVYDRTTLDVVRAIPIGAGTGGTALETDGAGGLVSSGPAGLTRVDADTGQVTWSRAVLPSEVCSDLTATLAVTMLCASGGRVDEFDAETGASTGRPLMTQLSETSIVSMADERTVLVDAYGGPLWMRWRIDGTGAGAEVAIPGRYLMGPPSPDGSLAATYPVDGGRMALWDLASGTPTGVTADGLTVLTDDVVEQHTEGEGFALRNLATGEVYPYRIPGLGADFELHPGGWSPLAFVTMPDKSLVAFDPATGLPVGSPLRVPGDDYAGLMSVAANADETLAAIVWFDAEGDGTRTAILRIADGAIVSEERLDDDHATFLASGDLIAVANESAERLDPWTFDVLGTLPRADGGSRQLVASTDDRTLLNVGFGDQVTLYDLERGIPLGNAINAETTDAVVGGYLTADGRTLLTNTPGGVVAWNLRARPQALAVCALAGRELSAAEWATYFPGEKQVATCAALAAEDTSARK